jgi:hypothetical protein
MTVDYRHPRLYVMLSNGEIESYAIDSSQPWKTNIYRFKGIRIFNLFVFRSFFVDVRPYAIDLHDDTLVVMIFNASDSTYGEMWVEKFGRIVTDQYRKFKTPMIVRYVHEYKYPKADTSNSKSTFLLSYMVIKVQKYFSRVLFETFLKFYFCIFSG